LAAAYKQGYESLECPEMLHIFETRGADWREKTKDPGQHSSDQGMNILTYFSLAVSLNFIAIT
jgi:hypothetical protein